jgi:hypothetical protein
MTKPIIHAMLLSALLTASPVLGQVTQDPFPQPINTTDGVVKVNYTEFASLPDVNPQDVEAARMMMLIDEPATHRLFVNDMLGVLYTVSYDGKTVTPYLDLREPKWNIGVQSQGSERGFQSFAVHPQFNQRGARGYGRFYTYTDTSNMTPTADFLPKGAGHTHDTIVLEWTAKDPAAARYDGEAPREIVRLAQPFSNHNGGYMTFNPLATPRDADYGLLYFGLADGGSGGDPYGHAQNLATPFGKILRIDPLGTNSKNGKYGIPAGNPHVNDNNPDTLGEIYTSGVRNCQRIFWDSKNGTMFMSDIGQNTVEKISRVTPGANLGWNVWEGSFRFVNGRGAAGGVDVKDPRSDPKITYPIVEFGQIDPLFQPNSAAIGGLVYRDTVVPQLTNLLLFGDNPSGEIFYVNADKLPGGGQDSIRRVMFNDKGETKNLLQLIKDKNAAQGKPPATRADLRFGVGPRGMVFVLNKRDGTIRLITK